MSDSTNAGIHNVPGRCPICGRANDCRMESGEAFKGQCWCAHLELSPEAHQRLADEVHVPRCLCRACLESLAANPAITWEELARVSRLKPAD